MEVEVEGRHEGNAKGESECEREGRSKSMGECVGRSKGKAKGECECEREGTAKSIGRARREVDGQWRVRARAMGHRRER